MEAIRWIVTRSTTDSVSLRNIVTVNMMEAIGEAQVFARKTGLGTAPMEELIGEAWCRGRRIFEAVRVSGRWMYNRKLSDASAD